MENEIVRGEGTRSTLKQNNHSKMEVGAVDKGTVSSISMDGESASPRHLPSNMITHYLLRVGLSM